MGGDVLFDCDLATRVEERPDPPTSVARVI
jgi:hypothetical protein